MIACTSPAFTSSERPLRISLPATRTWRFSIRSMSRILAAPTIELFDIGHVLGPTRGPFVDQQILESDEWNPDTAQAPLDSPRIAVVEVASRYPRQHVDPVRCPAQHQNGMRIEQVLASEFIEPEFRQCRENAVRILRATLNPEIDVFGGADETQCVDRHATDDEVQNVMFVE